MYELRMDPYRGKELMKYLKNKKYEENVINLLLTNYTNN